MSQLIQRGEASAGEASDIAIAPLGLGLVLTAFRDAEGHLQLVTWVVSADTQGLVAGGTYIVQKAQASAGRVSKVALVVLTIEPGDTYFRVITAVRTHDGDICGSSAGRCPMTARRSR